MFKIILLFQFLFSSNIYAAGRWGLEYNYDRPYEINNSSESLKTKEQVLVPRYRASYYLPIFLKMGVRYNLQRDNYFFDNNSNRDSEFSSKVNEAGLFYTFDDVIVEYGSSKGTSPYYKNKKITQVRDDFNYIRIGKNNFFKEGLDFLFKISSSVDGRLSSSELKIVDKTNIGKPTLKLRMYKTYNTKELGLAGGSFVTLSLSLGF